MRWQSLTVDRGGLRILLVLLGLTVRRFMLVPLELLRARLLPVVLLVSALSLLVSLTTLRAEFGFSSADRITE
jgi:hypothetical protein